MHGAVHSPDHGHLNDPGHLAHDMIYMLKCLGTFMLDKLAERLADLTDQLARLCLHELLWVLGESVHLGHHLLLQQLVHTRRVTT